MTQPTSSAAAHDGSDRPATHNPPRLVTSEPPSVARSVFDEMHQYVAAEGHENGSKVEPEAMGASAAPTERVAVTAEAFVPRRMILQVDASAQIVDVDWATTAALGWPSEELIGSSIFDWVHPSEIEESRRSWAELVKAHGSGRRHKARFWHSDGRWLWVEQTDRNLLDEASGTIISELVDITPEVEAQLALEARNRVLSVLSESPTTGIFEITPQRQVAFVNREWFAVAGLAEGAPFVAFLATLRDSERVERALTNASETGLESHFIAHRVDGSQVEVRVQSLPTPAGARNGVVAIDRVSPHAVAAPRGHAEPQRRFPPPAEPTPTPAAPLVAHPRAVTPAAAASRLTEASPKSPAAIDDAPSTSAAPADVAPSVPLQGAASVQAVRSVPLKNAAPVEVAPRVTTAAPEAPSSEPISAPTTDAPATAETTSPKAGASPMKLVPTVESAPNLPMLRFPVPELIPPHVRARQRLQQRVLEREREQREAGSDGRPIALGPGVTYSDSTELAVLGGDELSDDTGRLGGWAGFAAPEMVVVALIGIGALFVRLWRLATVPSGLHIEEGLVALAAQGVLDGTYPGFWDLDQTTVHMYAAAPFLAVFGDSVFALRLASALIGALTVAMLYVLTRPRFGRRVSLAAAATLALLTWHVHYSRVAFGAIWWPMIGLAAAAVIALALQKRSKVAFVAAGIMTGLGVYVSFEHWVFVLVATAFVAGWLLSTSRGLPLTTKLLDFGFYLVGLVATVAGMGWHLGKVPSWTELTEFNGDLTLRLDDGLGIVAPVPIVAVVAAAVGALVALVAAARTSRDRDPFLLLGIALIPAYVLATMLIDSDASFRQAFVVAPFVALLAGIGFAWAFQFLARHLGAVGAWSFAILIGLVFALTTVSAYFGDFSSDSEQRQLFTADYVEVAELVREVDGDPLVEVIVNNVDGDLVAPQLTFLTDGKVGANGLPADSSNEADRPRFFIILGQDAPQLATLESLYPSGTVTTRGVGDSGQYVAFFVPSAADGGGQ